MKKKIRKIHLSKSVSFIGDLVLVLVLVGGGGPQDLHAQAALNIPAHKEISNIIEGHD